MTLESKKTGRWFTYKIKKAKKDDDNSPYFVSLLTGQNNDSAYSYMGTIFNNNGVLTFKLTGKSNVSENAISYKAFNFFFNLLNKNKTHDDINFYHNGYCCMCGKNLTTAESLKSGLGPICENRIKK
jgi:hypothetical protein